MRLTLPLAPVPAPRQSRRDAWKPSPAVVRYREFRDNVHLLVSASRITIPTGGLAVAFELPMPPSWSRKKREALEGAPHTQKPDLDNLLKALQDSIWPEGDASIWHITDLRKTWAREGRITLSWDDATAAP